MFWFVFISIILFIIFLVVLLVSSKSSNDNTLRRLKDELEAKNRSNEEKAAVSKKTAPKPKKSPLKREEPKFQERVAAAAAAEDIPAVEEKAPSAVKEILEIEESVGEEEAGTSLEEAFGAEETVVEAAADETVEAEETGPAVEEPFITEEKFEPGVEEVVEEAEEEVSPEAAIEESVLAEEEIYSYPPFDNTRAMEEFGLPKEDADLFIVDLIEQIEDEMPALEVAVEAHDVKKIEDISHMIKGSATNLGTGGAADVLIDFNTYMKSGEDPLVIAAHMRNLHRALAELKEQFQ